jgi:hypothetical protein
MYNPDRVKMFENKDKLLTPPKDFHLDDFMGHGFKVVHDELYNVRVRISPGFYVSAHLG